MRSKSIIVTLFGLLALSGCAEFDAATTATTSYASTQVSAQVLNIQAANDVAAKTWASSGCAIPYGELVRNGSGNPNFAEAVVALCGGPSGYTMIHGTTNATISVIPATPAPTTPAP